jgi:hypothetical protein
MIRVPLPGTGATWQSSVTDSGIAADLAAGVADGLLSFDEAMRVVQHVAARGALTSAELASLRALVANMNLTFAADDYAASALADFVAGTPADAFSGSPSSSLALGVGASGASLVAGVQQWFLGTNLPDATVVVSDSSSTTFPVSYQTFSLPLFGSNGPSVSDVNQGIEGDCELCSGLIAMVLRHPDQLKSMFRDNGNGTWGVRFYVNGSEVWETVDARLPARADGTLAYVNAGVSDSPALWAALAEKAYAQLSATGLIDHPAVNSYANIASDPADTVYENLVNSSSMAYVDASLADWDAYKAVFISALAAGNDLVLETGHGAGDTTYDSQGRILLQRNHAYAVVGYDGDTGNFVVRNPWGEREGQTWVTQFEVSMADVVSVHGDIAVDDSAHGAIEVHETQRLLGGKLTPSAVVTKDAANAVARLFTVTNTSGQPITQYLLQAFGADTLGLNGATNLATAAQSAQGQVVVSAADLPKVTFTSHAASGTRPLMVAAGDGTAWSPMELFSLHVQAAKVLDQAGALSVLAPGQAVALDQLVQLDPSASYVALIAPAGLVNLNGLANLWTTNPPAGGIQVHASDLARITLTPPSAGSPVDLQVCAYDGAAWSAWTDVVAATGQSVARFVQLYDSGQSPGTAVADTAANVFANLDALQTMMAAGALQAVRVTDSSARVSLSAAQSAQDLGVLSIISGTFDVAIDAAGAGTQRIVTALPGAHTQYSVTPGVSVKGNGITESLSHVDRIAFSDGWLAFDLNGDAGVAYRLYQAAFNRKPDVAGLGYQTNALDHGLTIAQVAANFIASPEFQSTYGNVGDSQFVTLLYQNVLHRAPDEGGLAFHIGHLQGGLSRADVLAQFSESPENQAAVIGSIQAGIFYTLG